MFDCKCCRPFILTPISSRSSIPSLLGICCSVTPIIHPILPCHFPNPQVLKTRSLAPPASVSSCPPSIQPSNPNEALLQATAAFSLSRLVFLVSGLVFFLRMTASWPPRRLSSARSSFAPSASLLKFSLFSLLGTNRCEASFLFSSFSSSSVMTLSSCATGSQVLEATEGVSVGAVLYVLYRVDARLDESC